MDGEMEGKNNDSLNYRIRIGIEREQRWIVME